MHCSTPLTQTSLDPHILVNPTISTNSFDVQLYLENNHISLNLISKVLFNAKFSDLQYRVYDEQLEDNRILKSIAEDIECLYHQVKEYIDNGQTYVSWEGNFCFNTETNEQLFEVRLSPFEKNTLRKETPMITLSQNKPVKQLLKKNKSETKLPQLSNNNLLNQNLLTAEQQIQKLLNELSQTSNAYNRCQDIIISQHRILHQNNRQTQNTNTKTPFNNNLISQNQQLKDEVQTLRTTNKKKSEQIKQLRKRIEEWVIKSKNWLEKSDKKKVVTQRRINACPAITINPQSPQKQHKKSDYEDNRDTGSTETQQVKKSPLLAIVQSNGPLPPMLDLSQPEHRTFIVQESNRLYFQKMALNGRQLRKKTPNQQWRVLFGDLVPTRARTSFKVKQILEQNRPNFTGYIAYGICTQALKDLTQQNRILNNIQFIGYRSNAMICQNLCQSSMPQKLPINNNDIVEIILDTINWTISWKISNKFICTYKIIEQMQNKPLYKCVVMGTQGDIVQFVD